MAYMRHREWHRIASAGWLRAAVLGANDGLVSTASLVLGVAAAGAGRTEILVAGVAGLVAGSMSMAAGEYVSVRSQSDTETAALELERKEIETDSEGEHRELQTIYVKRGLEPSLAREVAEQLMAHDALDAHARDELGITETMSAQPLQAAFASATSFALGAAVPVAVALLVPGNRLIAVVAVTSVAFLATLGAWGAKMGGAPMVPAAMRVTFWGLLAMAVTAGVGHLIGAPV